VQVQGLVAPGPAIVESGKSALSLAPGQGGRNNKLLADHLAHEFLTHGTILGSRIEMTRGGPASAPDVDAGDQPDSKRRYAEVS
jgi:hypothetical protein